MCGDGFLVSRQINFRQRNHGAGDAKISQDLQMFLGLRHPTVVRGHDEQGEINRPDARHHVLHKILVARHVNDAEMES